METWMQREQCAKEREGANRDRWLKTMSIVGMMMAPTIASAAAPAQQAPAKNASPRPNIVTILLDDMGFSDLGSFGSEIKTPNLDSLARDGVRFTNFYTHASSSPTRSMLLSGVDTHLNGLGNMSEFTAPNQMGLDGYE
ncbi:MAG: atsA, partial [Acidobacteria bacterium]|nr:atsA [Acidobacteriota bacterium]